MQDWKITDWNLTDRKMKDNNLERNRRKSFRGYLYLQRKDSVKNLKDRGVQFSP